MRTSQANAELESYWAKYTDIKTSVMTIYTQIDLKKTELYKTDTTNPGYAHSRQSDAESGSVRSNSSKVAQKRGKAEAAKVKLRFAEEQASIKEEQNRLKVRLDLLNQKAEAAAAETEAKYLERETSLNALLFRQRRKCRHSIGRCDI